MPAERVIIAMGFDRAYAPHAAVVVASVVRNAPGGRFRFVMLCADVDKGLRRKFEAVAPGSDFVWRAVGEEDLPRFAGGGRFSRATLFRLGLETLAPADCKRVIYLDSDLALVHDIRELWRVDLGGELLAAVADDDVDARSFASQWRLPPEGGYFNAGVLLIDLAQVRAERTFSRAAAFLAEHGPELPWHDQDALNWACWERWRTLDRVWNVQRGAAIAFIHGGRDPLGGEEPRIVHYSGAEKPWIPGAYHPWSWLYWRNLRHTPFARDVAESTGIGPLWRLRLWLRWLRRWSLPRRGGAARLARNAAS